MSDVQKPAAPPPPAYKTFYEDLAKQLEEHGQATPAEARRIQAALDQLDSHAPVSQQTVAELFDSRLAPQFTFALMARALRDLEGFGKALSKASTVADAVRQVVTAAHSDGQGFGPVTLRIALERFHKSFTEADGKYLASGGPLADLAMGSGGAYREGSIYASWVKGISVHESEDRAWFTLDPKNGHLTLRPNGWMIQKLNVMEKPEGEYYPLENASLAALEHVQGLLRAVAPRDTEPMLREAAATTRGGAAVNQLDAKLTELITAKKALRALAQERVDTFLRETLGEGRVGKTDRADIEALASQLFPKPLPPPAPPPAKSVQPAPKEAATPVEPPGPMGWLKRAVEAARLLAGKS